MGVEKIVAGRSIASRYMSVHESEDRGRTGFYVSALLMVMCLITVQDFHVHFLIHTGGNEHACVKAREFEDPDLTSFRPQ